MPVLNGYVTVELRDGVVSVITNVDGGTLKIGEKSVEIKKDECLVIK